MKRFLLLLVVGLTGVMAAVADPPFAVSVSSASRCVAPARILEYARTWTNGIVLSQGERIVYGQSSYWCVTAGTSTNAPAPGQTGFEGNSAPLRWIPSTPRKGIWVCNDSTNVVYGTVGLGPAVRGRGFRLNAEGGSMSVEESQLQDGIYIVGPNDAGLQSNIVIQEW